MSPTFSYSDLLPLGNDETKYRLISSEGVSVVKLGDKEFLQVEAEALTTLTAQAIHDISHYLRPAHLQQLGLVPGDAVILAVVPEHRALVVINPCLFAGFAPAHVRAMLISGDDALAPVVSRALSSVVAGAQ